MRATENGDTFNCSCGFSWQRGQSGAHNCEPGLYSQISALQQKLDAVTAENVALKAAIKPAEIPQDVIDAINDTAQFDWDSNDSGSWTWIENDTEVAKAVLDAITLPGTPATDAILNTLRQESAPKDYFSRLVAMSRERAEKAMRKFPQPNYVLTKVAEECGELVKAGVHYAEGREEWINVENEAIDTIAMIFRLMTEGDQVIGFIPHEIALHNGGGK